MTKAKPPRKLSRAARRVQLIEATIEVLAIKGYARVTMSDVATQAGLSHGLVNFHFQSKDLLLAETLTYLADEYVQNWQSALSEAAPDPASQLDALIRADFRPELCTPQRLAAWCAFWGEAQSRPLYQAKCGENDRLYITKLEQVCTALLAEGRYPGDPILISRVLRVTSEGVWVDLISTRDPYSTTEALQTVHTAAMAFFPRHFGAEGLL